MYEDEWDQQTRDTSELSYVVQTPLHTTVIVDTLPKCEIAIEKIKA